MKIKIITLIALIAAGIIAFTVTTSSRASVEQAYNSNLANARANAEKRIPYNAYHYYLKAFEIRCENEEIYKEFLAQAKLLGKDYYNQAVSDYVARFPSSKLAHELYCQLLYENGNYKALIQAALDAREKGAATEKVRLWYTECSYMLNNVVGGFDEAQSFIGGYARVKVGDKYGFVTSAGEYLIAPIYSQATAMYGTNAAANDGIEWSMINTLGFTVARPDKAVDHISLLISGKIAIGISGKYGYTDAAMVVPETLPYDYASTYKNGVASVKKGDKWALIDEEEKQITEYIFEEVVLDEFDTCISNGVIFVKKDGAYYMVDAKGNKIVDQSFEKVYPFIGNEPAAVCINGKWGFVDSNGKTVIEPKYDDAKSFNLGLGAVCVDGKWGYINTDGEVRIVMSFEDCLPFAANGIAAVKLNDKWHYRQLLPYDN